MIYPWTNLTPKLAAAILALGTSAVGSAQAPAGGAEMRPRENESKVAQTMGIRQNLGKTVDSEAVFFDEAGSKVRFGDLLGKRPVVVVPIWYRCQTACAVVTDKLMKTLAKTGVADTLVVGRDLDVVMISLHPKETPELAFAKKQRILNALEPPKASPEWRERSAAGWHNLTGDVETVRKFVTEGLGVKYRYDAKNDLINHPTCTVFLSKEGKIGAYTIGNDFPTVLAESNLAYVARNEVAPRADQTMMFGCIMLDPETGRYRPIVQNILRVAGVATVIGMAAFIVSLNLQSKRKQPNGGGDARVI